MNPDYWSTFQQYAQHSAFAAADQAGLGASLDLSQTNQPQAALSQRAFSTIPAANYLLTNPAMSQMIQAAQLPQKAVSLDRNQLVLESARNEQPSSVSSIRSVDTPHSYSSSSVSQSASLESSSKGWGLNFIPQASSAYDLASLGLSNAVPMTTASHRTAQPPPAHSSDSRQRNSFVQDEVVVGGRVVKLAKQYQPELLALLNSELGKQPTLSAPTAAQTAQQQVQAYSLLRQDLKDMSSTPQNLIYYATSAYTTTTSSNPTSFAASQLSVADVNYDPVSPATPLSENQTGEATFTLSDGSVALADLNTLAAAGHQGRTEYRESGTHRAAAQSESDIIQQHSQLMAKLSAGTARDKSHLSYVSPGVDMTYQQAVNRASSQASMSTLGSGQNQSNPSSSVRPMASPVQAVADSSTAAKPRKPRSRKKTKPDDEKSAPPPPAFNQAQQPGYFSASQGYSSSGTNFQTPTSRALQQYQQTKGSPVIMQTQFGNSASSAQNAMRAHVDALSGEGSYQVLSSVAANQVSPAASGKPANSQKPGLDTASAVPLASSQVSATTIKGSSETPLLSVAYQGDQGLVAQHNAQYALQAFATDQSYVDDLASRQSVTLIPGSVFTEAIHTADGIADYPAYQYQTTAGSTIDEATFSSMLQSEAGVTERSEPQAGVVVENLAMQRDQAPAPEPSATCTNPVEEDDELSMFACPPPEPVDKEKAAMRPAVPLAQNTPDASASEMKPPQLTPKPSVSSGFQDTFLSFLSGKKQETLSSVTSAVIGEKPQLPKYIPEPRRPPPPPQPAPSSVSFTDDEDDSNEGMAVRNALSTLDSDSNDSEVPEVRGSYSVQRTNDLTMKITLQNTLNKQQRARGRSARGRGGAAGRGRGDSAKSKSAREPTPPPRRESIGRRAKDAAKSKKKKYNDASDAEDSEGEVKRRGSGSEYDSDRDPVWTPLEEQEPKRPPGFNLDLSGLTDVKAKKPKSKSKRGPKSDRGERLQSGTELSDGSSAPAAKMARTDGGSGSQACLNGGSKSAQSVAADDENYRVGCFVLEKKDLSNYESYPIWRLEPGGMLRKFELFVHEGRVCHRPVSTYSSWVPTMRAGYIPIRVAVVSNVKFTHDVVEVLEGYQPTPPTDGSLEHQYENDPLVEDFNIYLQIFLSQSLETSFLAAVRDEKDSYYLQPLEKIDQQISLKLDEIDRTVEWQPNFRECMRTRPEKREVVRPNLKQSCQACKKSTPPTIKSVHFHGCPYDQFLLAPLPNSTDSSQEFNVGKVAAPYIHRYHSLVHFKYHLFQRCKAKIHLVQASNKLQSAPSESQNILEQCLTDRSWVLDIFRGFKVLLDQ